MRIQLTVIVTALTLSACVPFPNRRLYAPKVTGSLVRDGAPVAGAEILLTATFTKASATTTTDADGRFKLGPLTKMYLTKSLLGDPLYAYVLRIKVGESTEYRGFEARSLGAAPGPLEVTCDLSKPIARGKSLTYCSQNSPR